MTPNTNPQAGNLKTVDQFLSSPQPIKPMPANQQIPPAYLSANAYPMMPAHQQTIWDRASQIPMELTTLFARGYGSTAR